MFSIYIYMVQHGGISPFKNPFSRSKKTKLDTEIITETKKYIQETKNTDYLTLKQKLISEFGEEKFLNNKTEIQKILESAAKQKNSMVPRGSVLRPTAYGKLGKASLYVPKSLSVNKGPSGIPAEKQHLELLIYDILDNKTEEINRNKNYFTKSMGLTEGIAIETVKNNPKFRQYVEQQPRIRSNIVHPNSTTPFKDLFGMDEDSFIKKTYKEYKRNSKGGKKKSAKKTKKRITKKTKKRITKKTKKRITKKTKKRSTRKH